MKPDTEWQVAASAALGSRIVKKTGLGGGDFATSCRVLLADGRTVFIKTHHDPPNRFFSTEACGLGWLRESPAVHVPEVLAVADDPPFLALAWIDAQARNAPDEAAFGRALAALHRQGFKHFGRTDRCTTGSLALPNQPMACWCDFYANQRLRPLAARARELGALPPGALRAVETLADRLATLDVPDEPPARLHGDLWSGNRLVDRQGASWLIDPAVHGGHREFDLAMMRLFGGFSARCFAAYQEAWPLTPGWQERIELHQLAPLLVHAVKFGGYYIEACETVLERYA